MAEYKIPVFLAGCHIFRSEEYVTVPGICPGTKVLVENGARLTVTGRATGSEITVEPKGQLDIEQKDGVDIIQQ